MKLRVPDYEVIDSPEEVKARVKEMMKGGALTFETKQRTKNGKIIDVRVTTRIIELAGKKFVHLTGQDITEQKKLRDQLRENEKKYRSLFSSMSEGVYLHEIVYDETGKAVDYTILEVNSAYETLTGIKRENAIGKRAIEVYETKEPPYLDIYAKVAESGEPTTFEAYFPPLRKQFRIAVFLPVKGQFATIFTDTTSTTTVASIHRRGTNYAQQ